MLELDEKVATLHFLALNVELIVLAQKQASSTRVKVEDRFLRAGHGNEDAPLGNGVLLYVLPGLAFLFPVHLSFIILPTSRFEVYVLLPIAPFVFTEAVEPRTDARVFQLTPSLPWAVTGARIR